MFKEFAEFLRDNRDKIVKKVRTNVVRELRGYSEYTNWMETISYDEVEVFDFDALLEQMDEFSKTFEGGKNV